MRRVYVVLAGLQLLAVLVQFYFAAVGSFAKPRTDDSFALHSMTGMMIIPLISVLATIAAAAARAPGRLIGLTILPLGLVIVQVLIILFADAFNDSAGNTTPAGLVIVGLHAINGLAIMAVAGFVFRGARGLLASPTSTPPTAATVS